MTKRPLPVRLSAVFVAASFCFGGGVYAQSNSGPLAEQARLIGEARQAGVVVRWDAARRGVASIRGTDLGARASFSSGRGLLAARRGDYAADAIAVLDNVSGMLRARDAGREFGAKRVRGDRLGFHHVRVAQMNRGVRVVGAELIVHFDRHNRAYEVNGRYIPEMDIETTPTLTPEEATTAAQSDLTRRGLPGGELRAPPELVVYARRAPFRLAYELTLVYGRGTHAPGRWLYWVDAQTGRVLERIDNIHHVPAPTTNGVHTAIQGSLLYGEGGGATNVIGWQENSATNYYLFNTNRQWTIKNSATGGWPDAGTYAYRGTTNWGTSDPAEISAANAIDFAQRYFSEIHDLNSYDNDGALTQVNVHEGTNYVNAFWDGAQLYIGDGNGVDANSLAVMDVIGHEFTHAVTEYSANLFYADESGALNESFSDIFGASIEFFAQPDDRAAYPDKTPGMADWLVGEDSWLASTALRDMRNPANEDTVGEGNGQPTRYRGEHWYVGTLDLGGVHQNSGVQNFFYYLLSEGGSGTNDGIAYDLPGIGLTNAEQIAFRALTVYCTPDTGYREARSAWLSAAQDLNTQWVEAVSATWTAVGLQTLMLEPANGASFVGPQGGPFQPEQLLYSLFNDSADPITWGATGTEEWLEITPDTGVVDPFSSTTITVAVNNAAMPPGAYSALLHLTNSASAIVEERGVVLRIMPPVVLEYDLDANPGWDTDYEWEFGTPTGNGAEDEGYPDPTSGATGTNVYGVNLDGDYSIAVGGPYYLTAGPFDFSEYTNMYMSFARWLNTDYQPYVRTDIQISTNGTEWATLWENPDYEAIVENAWSHIVEDISEYAPGADTVYIRWGYEIILSGAYLCSGWNIDDIVFYANSRDALLVQPAAGFSASGYEGGPFGPTGIVWTITNSSTDSLPWSVAGDTAWFYLSATGGTLEAGASTTVVGTLELSIAELFAPGDYSADAVFSNEVSGFSATRPLALHVLPRQGQMDVRDSIPPEDDYAMPFGEAIIGTRRVETITITNNDAIYPVTVSNILFEGFSEESHLFAAPNILVYADDPTHWAPTTLVDQALQEMGLPYTAIYENEFEDFENALANDGPWDLVILAAERWAAPETTYNALLNFLNDGGRLIAHSWKVHDGHPLWAAMGVSFVSNITNTPASVYWWEPQHRIFNEPEQVPEFTNFASGVFKVYGQYVEPSGNGVALAGYTGALTADNAALIVANGGRSIFRGFFDGANSADLDLDGNFDGVELWENLIQYSLSGLAFHGENVPVLPHELAAGESVSFDIAYEPQYPGTNYGRVTILSTDTNTPQVAVELSGVAVEDPLQISPRAEFSSIGRSGGPFEPEEMVYTLSNTFASAIVWSASSTQTWLSVEPAGGSLSSGETQVVTARIVTASAPVAAGVYRDEIVFSNETTTALQRRRAKLTVFTTPTIIVSAAALDVTNRIGETQFRDLAISNAPTGGGDLSFSIHARVTNRPPLEFSGHSGLYSAPPDHDFNQVAPDADFVPDELLVRFVPGVTTLRRDQVLAAFGARAERRGFRLVPDLYLVTLTGGQRVEDALPTFNGAPEVLYAEPNYIVRSFETIPDDPQFGDLWGMSSIDAPDAWDFATGNPEIIVAVTDSGIDYNHEDLAANMWINTGEIPENGIDDDGNGYVDDIYGVNVITGSGNPMDDNSHGTHCAGTIGALGNNGTGVAGVNWRVRLMACKFLASDGYGTTANSILSTDYATESGANVISASWGGGGYSQGLKDSIDEAGQRGILFVAAAGNDASDNDGTPTYPASFASPNMIVVMATDSSDNKASYSNYGETSVHIGAPGSSILSVKMGGGYSYKSGTSMATPHVAGAAALLLSVNPLLTAEDLKEILINTVDPTLPGLCVSGGRLNLAAAIAELDSPWISFNPAAASNIAPESATNVSVAFSAGELPPGVYAAEVTVRSNDRTNPVVKLSATMTILADDMTVSPTNTAYLAGFQGGPFVPRIATYTVSNESASAIDWTANASALWLETPGGGTLSAGGATQVVVSIASAANMLASGVHTGAVVFSNATTGATRTREVRLTILPAAVWVNEVNYSPEEESGEPFVELAGVAGADLSVFRLALWNEGGEEPYTNIVLGGAIDNEGCGFGAVAFDVPGIQTNAPGGILLAHAGDATTSLVQFVSYGGTITITNDSFGIIASENIGGQPSGANDLQLAGTGDEYAAFAWATNAPSKGWLNTMQEIGPCADDRDNDQLPDWWESLYGLDPTVSNPPSSNADADWMTDWEEYVADTDPSDPDSVFPLVTATNPPERVISLIVNPSSTARMYGVLWTTNLLDEPQIWTLYPPEKPGTGEAVEFSITNDAPERSYRTGVRLP